MRVANACTAEPGRTLPLGWARYAERMDASTTADASGGPAWERELRSEAGSKGHYVRIFAREHFPALATALELAPGELLEGRVLVSITAFDRDAASAPQWDEYRARLWAACAWWGVSDVHPTREQWTTYTANAKRARVHDYASDLDRRAFRHAWAMHEYRGRRQGLTRPFPLAPGDAGKGRHDPFKTEIQDAFVAFLLALTNDGDGHEFWNPRINKLDRVGTARDALVGLRKGDTEASRGRPDAPVFLEQVRRLRDETIPAALRQAVHVARDAGMPEPQTWAEFSRRLSLLLDIRSVLDRLKPDIFSASVGDVISLTPVVVGSSPVKAHSRYLQKLVARYTRPGVTLTQVQLGNAAALAFHVGHEWRRLTGEQPPTVVPLWLDELHARWRVVEGQLDAIDRVAQFDAENRLAERPIPDLQTALSRVASQRL